MLLIAFLWCTISSCGVRKFFIAVQLSSHGLLNSHYSPMKPIFLLGKVPAGLENKSGGFISFSGNLTEGYKVVEHLSRNKDLKEAAANLFSILHKLEEIDDIDYIIAEPVPTQGIGIAIMEKLKKASYQYLKH